MLSNYFVDNWHNFGNIVLIFDFDVQFAHLFENEKRYCNDNELWNKTHNIF